MAGAGDVTAGLATLGAAGWAVTAGSAFTSPSDGSFKGLTATGAVALSPASANVVLAPTGTGVVTINPATAGTINNVSVGVTTPAVVKTSGLQAVSTDSSGTPGAATINTTSGRCAIAAAATSVVITNSLVTAASKVFVKINQAAADVTLTSASRVSTAAGSFTIFGNAAATAAVVVDFLVVN